MKFTQLVALTVLAIVFLSSCGPTHTFKNMNYLADSVTEAEKTVQPNSEILLQPGDRISILVSALNPVAAQAFNLGSTAATEAAAGSTVSSPGYLVGSDGTIQFPQLGKIVVKGKTTEEIGDTIQTGLTKFLKEPVVYVSLVNFKVNVLGEVNKPGTIVVPDGKITILEAISESGDLTINGLRENVMVVRESEGKREFGTVNLASNKLFNSPYFYLKQGDVVYVAMNENKLLSSDAQQLRRYRVTSLVLAAVSVAVLLINLTK
jgi:polysaccharide export outer membrane protein